MMTVREVTEWLNGISDDNYVAVDDGGLKLVEVESRDAISGEYHNYIEVGGDPDLDNDYSED